MKLLLLVSWVWVAQVQAFAGYDRTGRRWGQQSPPISLATYPTTLASLRLQSRTTKGDDDRASASSWWGPVAMTLASWTLATQFAVATPTMTTPSAPTFLEQPGTLVAAIETMDFSMPSYSDAVKGDTKTSSSVPSFNPFGDFEPKIVSSDQDEDRAAKKEEERAAAEAKREEARAAAEAKREEAREAAEAKKAEREARRQAELEKQKAAVERANQPAEPVVVKAEEAAAPRFSMPEVKLEMPDMPKMPDMPEIKMPDMPDMPDIKMPDMPKLSMPKFELPKMEMPGGDFNMDVPKVDLPKVDLPKVDLPKIDLPKISLPSLPNPFGGGDAPSGEEVLEPQEVRDELARQARQVFLAADEAAKLAEEQARQVREVANEKRKEASLAKDEACKTRPGGKWICLRNPFNAGF